MPEAREQVMSIRTLSYRRTFRTRRLFSILCGLLVAGAALSSGQEGEAPKPAVLVKIQDEKPTIVEMDLPVDPVKHITYQAAGNMGIVLRVENKTMHLGNIYTNVKIGEQVTLPNAIRQNMRLPKRSDGKERDGIMGIYEQGKIRITQTLEVTPTKPGPHPSAGKKTPLPTPPKLRLDSVMIRYLVENKDTVPHKVGVRVGMDLFWVNNDGALFASPTTEPGKVLDGVELKDKAVPDFLQVLQQPNIKNPGEVAHFSYNFGRAVERPNRLVLTRLGAQAPDGWNWIPTMAMGDSAFAMFWDPVEIRPGGKRELAYAYGKGVAISPKSEEEVKIVLGGSFEPGKLFTISAYVRDPGPGQTLALELPAGMERVEGKELQPVAGGNEDGDAMVLWKARVQRTGQFTVRIRSSSGVTQTKVISISRPGENSAGQ
jgi:hypothetical protein